MTDDGVPDVVAFTIDNDERIRMTCRSGTDGRVVGTVIMQPQSRIDPVGSTWHAAIVSDTSPAPPGNADGPRLTVRWVEGCRQRWARTFTARGEDATGAAAGGAPFFRGTLTSSTGRAAVVVEMQTITAVHTNLTWRNVVRIVSGEDGSSLLHSEPLTFVDEFPELVTLPDVSADGLGDYAYAVDDAMGLSLPTRGDRLVAYAADDGRKLWALATQTVDGPDLDAVGDVDGDGTTDFVLSPLLGPREFDTTGAELVSGATGTVLWRHRAWDPRVVSVRPLHIGLSALTEADSWYWLEVAAADAVGSQRYASRHRVAPSASGTTTFLRDESLGDVDSDGVIDVVHRIRVTYPNEPDQQLNLVVSGRSGATRTADVRSLVPFGWPAGTAVLDGRGDDVWSPGTLTIRSGDDGTQLARWLPRTPVARMFVTRVDHDTCPDLFVQTGMDLIAGTGDENTPRQLFMVSGATGNVVWSLPASKPGRHVLDGRLGTCGASPPASPPPAAPPPAVARPPARIPATGAAPAWGAVVVAATAVVAGRLRRRATADASAHVLAHDASGG